MKAFSFTAILVLGGGACAAVSAAADMAAAVNADESTYCVGIGAFFLLFAHGSRACAGLPSDRGCYDSNQHMIQTDFLDTTNMTGGAAAATATSYSSPGPSLDHGYLCSDLLFGSGGEKKIGNLACSGMQGLAPAQRFYFPGISNRCGTACALLVAAVAAAVPHCRSPHELWPQTHRV